MKPENKIIFGNTFVGDPGYRVYLQNVHPGATLQDFRDFFADCNLVALCIWENRQGLRKGCARFATPLDTSRAISKHMSEFVGWSIHIREFDDLKRNDNRSSIHHKTLSLRKPSPPKRRHYERGDSRERDRSRSRSPYASTKWEEDRGSQSSRRQSESRGSSERREPTSQDSRSKSQREDRRVDKPRRGSADSRALIPARELSERDSRRQSRSTVHEDALDRLNREKNSARRSSTTSAKSSKDKTATTTIVKPPEVDFVGKIPPEIEKSLKEILNHLTVRKMGIEQLRKLISFFNGEELVMIGINPLCIPSPTTTSTTTNATTKTTTGNGMVLNPSRIQIPTSNGTPSAKTEGEPAESELKIEDKTASVSIVKMYLEQIINNPNNPEVSENLKELVNTVKQIHVVMNK